MACKTIVDGRGFTVIACERGGMVVDCSVPHCGRQHTRLCDYRLANGQTCDKKLCVGHAVRVGPGKDHCPAHAKVSG